MIDIANFGWERDQGAGFEAAIGVVEYACICANDSFAAAGALEDVDRLTGPTELIGAWTTGALDTLTTLPTDSFI
jgi:hypothetical protein